MGPLFIRELTVDDKEKFLAAMQRSESLHHPWVTAPITPLEFNGYIKRYQQSTHKSFLVCDELGNIAGVFNISEMVRGLFQNAYLGFYAVADFAGKGYMSAGLKLVLAKVFNELKLHRIEANIQPDNRQSIQLVQNNGFRYEGFSPRYLKINGEWRGHEHWAMTIEDYVSNDPEILKKDYVDIVAYDVEWPNKASIEISKLRAALPVSKIMDIQHVGSTAIPNMPAKPIIDIQIAVHSLEEMKVIAVPALQKLGYEYWADNPDPQRLFFVKGMPPFGDKRTHHVHIFLPTSEHWQTKIIFRDYLLTHPDMAQAYLQLKLRLAQQYVDDREQYTEAKREFVSHVMELAKKENQSK